MEKFIAGGGTARILISMVVVTPYIHIMKMA